MAYSFKEQLYTHVHHCTACIEYDIHHPITTVLHMALVIRASFYVLSAFWSTRLGVKPYIPLLRSRTYVAWSVSVACVGSKKTDEPVETPLGSNRLVSADTTIIRCVCILAPPDEYDWTTRARRWCGLLSNYTDHSFALFAVVLRECQQLGREMPKHCISLSVRNETVPKIIINNTTIFFLNCNQHFGNFKPYQFPIVVW